MAEGALEGIRVVDIGGTIATGYCGKLFADYGAEVINLEPADGFATRHLGPFLADSSSALHAYLNTGKKSVVPVSTSDAEHLVAGAALVLDGDVPHPLAEHCSGVLCSIRWYGEGPYGTFSGTDAQMFAFNGMLRSIGVPEGPPIIPTGYQAQVVGGVTAYIASLTEVLGRELGNASGPTVIETSIFEAMLCFTDVGVVSSFNSGIVVPRLGINRYPPTYPLGVFPCRDGWLGVTVLTPTQWHAFCALLGLDDLAHIDLFQTSVGRLQAVDMIEPMFCEKLLEHAAEDLFYRGQAARIPLARVPTMEELFGVDQFLARHAFAEARLPGGSVLTVPTTPFRLFATPPHFGGDVASLGEHTAEFL